MLMRENQLSVVFEKSLKSLFLYPFFSTLVDDVPALVYKYRQYWSMQKYRKLYFYSLTCRGQIEVP